MYLVITASSSRWSDQIAALQKEDASHLRCNALSRLPIPLSLLLLLHTALFHHLHLPIFVLETQSDHRKDVILHRKPLRTDFNARYAAARSAQQGERPGIDLVHMLTCTQIYDHVLDIECKTGFAPLLRVNGQIHDEAHEVMLKKYSFVLVEFAWKQDEAVTRRMINVIQTRRDLLDSSKDLDPPRIPGTFSSLSYHTPSISTFRHYSMRITITRGKKVKKTTFLMLVGEAALKNFALFFGCSMHMILPSSIEVRYLTYTIEVFPRASCASEHTKALLGPLQDAWRSFTSVKVRCRSAPDVAENVQKCISSDGWNSAEEYLRTLVVTYHVALALWDEGLLNSAQDCLHTITVKTVFTNASRQFDNAAADIRALCELAFRFFVTVAGIAMAGIAITQAMSSKRSEKEAYLEDAKAAAHQAMMQMKTDTYLPRGLMFLTYLHKAIIDGFIGDQAARREALSKAEVYAESVVSLKIAYKQILEGKLRIPMPEEILPEE